MIEIGMMVKLKPYGGCWFMEKHITGLKKTRATNLVDVPFDTLFMYLGSDDAFKTAAVGFSKVPGVFTSMTVSFILYNEVVWTVLQGPNVFEEVLENTVQSPEGMC